ncbi:class II aldolase/adducin family protein [Acetobacter musti]|uniref:Class II aldolase/adducin family protein n=2 Tax=Acetobacter musti TaxID=864732 RepID=A0ABX0JWE7_9PROT|nr:class II aldolase/adducin family protein [Acetobacter musti]
MPLGGALPRPRVFSSFQDERAHCRNTLARAFRVFGRLGLAEGIAGHITVRDPEFHDRLWVNPYAVHFSRITADDLICISKNGEVVSGDGPVNAAAVAIHCGIHRENPDVVAAVHTHTTYGRAMSALNQYLLPVNQEACAFFENHILFRGDVVVLSDDEGTRIGKSLGKARHAIMQNHGLLTTGSSIEAACYRFISMERCCEIQLLASSAGQLYPLSDDEARKVKASVGSDYVAWLAFRGIMDVYSSEEQSGIDV